MIDAKQFIEKHIPQMDSVEKVYQLFDGLGYKILDTSYRGKEAWGLREKDRENVNTIYSIANYKKIFGIFLVELNTYSSDTLRNLPLYFEREFQYPFFVITEDYKNYTFVLVEKTRLDVGEWKRKLIKLNLDIKNAYHTDKLILSESAIGSELQDPLQIYKTLTKSFSVEKVTRRFFDDYCNLFKYEIKPYLLKHIPDTKWAHDYGLQLLNRIMFLYFIQKKRWLDDNPQFINKFWKAYKENTEEKDSFYDKWLSVLFFEAFNNRFSRKPYFPDQLNYALALAPFLNGGLFTRNTLDQRDPKLKDTIFDKIFAFYNRYNFTIREELPLEVEVAVDPEMIGKVYESLLNISEEADERGEAGIFYTARIEIGLMCRRSLVEYFHNHLNIEKSLIYEFIFAKTDEEKKKADEKITQHNLWTDIEILLDDLSVIDPACGSGSFLVGMLNILSDLYKRIYSHRDIEMSDFDIKKSIVGRSLYGVDIMDWAVHVAELRLWLQLIVETELTPNQLRIQPLLPNLSFKIRQGNSLVQEIGGINLAVRASTSTISATLKRRLTNLQNEKIKYYNNDPSRKYRSESMLLQEELNIFRDILDDRALMLSNKIKSRQHGLNEVEMQDRLYKDEKIEKQIYLKHKKAFGKEIEQLRNELEKVKEARQALIGIKDKPFVWDIDFAEIFSGEKRGFDIVIGNPPYVRQEKIAPPLITKEKVTNEMKREYKDKLEASVRAHFDAQLPQKLDKKSDLYIYFYLHGLSLLNSKGTFCFITSNSWLDVGYGKNLQEFLLKNVHIKAIYDNSAKRSFSQSDINTIIAVFSHPLEGKKTALDYNAKFVLYKKPYEDVINIDNLIEIDETEETLNTDSFRVLSISQRKLLEEGWEYPEDITEEQKKRYGFNIGKYSSNKWGGKYLRAPEIYFVILEKSSDMLDKIGKYFKGERYLNTGGADGFYIISNFEKIDEKYAKIVNTSKEGRESGFPEFIVESKFFKPLIKNITKHDRRPIVTNTDAWVLNLPLPKQHLKNLKIKEYVSWGEKKGFHKRSVTSIQKPWYKPTNQIKRSSKILLPRSFSESFCIFYNPKKFISLRYYRLYENENADPLFFISLMNSTLFYFFIEVHAAKSLGLGVLDIFMADFLRIQFPIISNKQIIKVFEDLSKRNSLSIFNELGINSKQPIRSQKPNPLPDRKALDDIFFETLGLTQAERDEVYWAVCELVKNRLEKAKSV